MHRPTLHHGQNLHILLEHDPSKTTSITHPFNRLSGMTVLSVGFEVGVSLLLAPAGADKRGPKAPFPLVENARIQPVTRKRVPAGAPAGAGSH